ncbi:uncharacterized protein LOC136040828 isoform X2 [Artemia franciscana]|uniref:uncharacterized protein LOC136040828 isoform X2 n=1 Tax=Artemia franciscana TaxID=6661 RepID=UPI0032DACCDD
MEDQQEESSVLQSLLDQGPTTSQRHASPEHLMSGQSKPFISDVDFEKFNGNVSPRQEDKIDPTPASTCISKIYNASASQRHASQEHLMSGQSKPFISDVDFEKFNGNVSPRQEDKNDPTPAENLRNQQITQRIDRLRSLASDFITVGTQFVFLQESYLLQRTSWIQRRAQTQRSNSLQHMFIAFFLQFF